MSERVDWPTIKEIIAASDYDIQEPFLFVLPHAGRHLLLALAQRLEWKATYSDKSHGYNYSDWDELQAIVAATHAGLMEMEQVNLIVAKLEEIRQELELLRGATGDTEALDLIADGVGLLDPRLNMLLQGLDAIENLMGGSWVPGLEQGQGE
jgi:hypothetical protein